MDKVKGFTLMELLIVLFIFSIVMVITYSSLMTHQRISKAEREYLILSQNLRATADLLANYIRMAGFGTKYSLSYESGNNVNGYSQVFTAVDNSDGGSDRLTIVYANRIVGQVTLNQDNETQYSGNTIYIVSNNINLLDNDKKRYVFFERNPYNRFYELQANPVSLGNNKYKLIFPQGTHIDGYNGDNVYAVRAITIYYKPESREIMISDNIGPPQPVADDIETIQFQFGIDENGDGIFDDTDNDGNPLDNTVPPAKEKFLKVVKISILGRTAHPDPKYIDQNSSYRVANFVENLSLNDRHYRRKLVELYITPRNYEFNQF